MTRLVTFLLALLIALVALCLSFAASNWQFMGWEEKSLMSRTELVKQFFKSHKNPEDKDVVLIDVTYDKELRTIYLDDGTPLTEDFQWMELGNTQVTDRKKLLEFLKILKEQDDYKYILLDIEFPRHIESSEDSLLFETIAGLRNIILPLTTATAAPPEMLIPKTAAAEYRNLSVESDFIKFPFLFEGRKSIPVVMYEDLDSGHIKDHGWFITDNGVPAKKSIPLPLDFRLNMKSHTEGGSSYIEEDQDLFLLGRDILGYPDSSGEENFSILEDEPDLFKDKIIVVGSFSGDDDHSTYVGDMPGSLILYNGYLSLKKGRHLMNWRVITILYLIFLLISLLILRRRILIFSLQFAAWVSEKRWQKKIFRLQARLIENFAAETFLVAACVAVYIISGEIYDIIVTGFYFILVNWVVRKFSFPP